MPGIVRSSRNSRDLAIESAEDLNALAPVLRENGLIAVALPRELRRAPHGDFTVDHENLAARSWPLRRTLDRSRGGPIQIQRRGKKRLEATALAGMTRDFQSVLMTTHDSEHGRKTNLRPVNVVVKKGSKIRARVASSIPEPLSLTIRAT
jgi:hypothetical protein